MGTELEQRTEVWDKLWNQQASEAQVHDPMSFFISHAVKQDFEGLLNRKPISAIEMGAGPGRSSQYLNSFGIKTGILDYSDEAIALAKKVNAYNPSPTRYYTLDIFKVSPQSIPENYDLVWNAGVLEHFSPEQQKEILSRMASVQDASGLTMVLTPYAGSVLYRLGKWVLEKLGRFPYGQETPVRTLKPVLPENVELVVPERSVGFVILLFNGFKALSNIPGLGGMGGLLQKLSTTVVTAALTYSFSRKAIFLADRILSKILGGYLLLTVYRTKKDQV